jgi:ABC-type transport system involved in multi-copper enzyme maturation permease subunit
MSLGFGILLLLHLILLGFPMLISRVVELTERALLALAIFLDLLLFVVQLVSSLLLYSPPQRLSI